MNVNKFAISNHMALKLDVQALRNYLSLICEHEIYILPNKKVSTAKDHGNSYIKDRPPLVRRLLRNCLLFSEVEGIHYWPKLIRHLEMNSWKTKENVLCFHV